MIRSERGGGQLIAYTMKYDIVLPFQVVKLARGTASANTVIHVTPIAQSSTNIQKAIQCDIVLPFQAVKYKGQLGALQRRAINVEHIIEKAVFDTIAQHHPYYDTGDDDVTEYLLGNLTTYEEMYLKLCALQEGHQLIFRDQYAGNMGIYNGNMYIIDGDDQYSRNVSLKKWRQIVKEYAGGLMVYWMFGKDTEKQQLALPPHIIGTSDT